MNEDRIREIFAEEMEKGGDKWFAARIRDKTDNSLGGTAAIAAMIRIVKEITNGNR